MKTSVNIKMDVEDRDAAKKLFDSLGLDMTTAVNLFVKASLREKAIPFQIAAEQSDAMQERFERELKKDLQASVLRISCTNIKMLRQQEPSHSANFIKRHT